MFILIWLSQVFSLFFNTFFFFSHNLFFDIGIYLRLWRKYSSSGFAFTFCVILGKSVSISGLQFPHLSVRYETRYFFPVS